MTKKFTLILLCSIVFAFASCRKFDGQSVPAYIHIDSISLDCDYFVYGANTCNFTDAWVYVDDQIIGCYELPATFPILKNGPHKVSIFAGICVNGIGDTRSPYVFCQPKIYQNLNLVEDSIINLNPVVTYYPIGGSVNLSWMEDFESTNSLLPMSQSDTAVIRVSDPSCWHSPNSFYSGRVALPPDSLDFWVASAEEMNFHSDYVTYCMLEMDYNCNDTFFVGLLRCNDYSIIAEPLVKVIPTDKTNTIPNKWKKMYVNLGPYMNSYVTASYFKVYFTSNLQTIYDTWTYKPNDEQRYFYFDNLKVLYR